MTDRSESPVQTVATPQCVSPRKRKASRELPPPKRLKTINAPRAVLPELVFPYFTVEDLKPLHADIQMQPILREWWRTANVNWMALSRTAEPWMEVLLDNPCLDLSMFLVEIEEWKLRLLLKRADELKWFHWRQLSSVAKEWMLPLFEKHPEKIFLSEFMLGPVRFSEVRIPRNRPPAWKQLFITQHMDRLDMSILCRISGPWMLEAMDANFDRVDLESLFAFTSPWKTELLKNHRDQVDWSNISRTLWKQLVRNLQPWMPIENYLDKIDIGEVIKNMGEHPSKPFVDRLLAKLPMPLICEYSKPWMSDYLNDNLDRLHESFFLYLLPWKLELLERNKSRFDWENASPEVWSNLSRNLEPWMPIDEHWEKVDMVHLIGSIGYPCEWKTRFIEKHLTKDLWNELKYQFSVGIDGYIIKEIEKSFR